MLLEAPCPFLRAHKLARALLRIFTVECCRQSARQHQRGSGSKSKRCNWRVVGEVARPRRNPKIFNSIDRFISNLVLLNLARHQLPAVSGIINEYTTSSIARPKLDDHKRT
jgi:hypothetical protein